MISGVDIRDFAPRLIGLTGKAGSGKDTVGGILKRVYDFQTVAFADPIRAAMRGMIGLSPEQFAHPLKEEVIPDLGKSPRQMMQTLGTEWGRQLVNEDIWLILANRKIQAWFKLNTSVAVTDVRFENEAAFIRNNGGVVWHINRGGAGTKHAHASEAGVRREEGDVVIDNNGTLEELFQIVKRQATTTEPVWLP